MKSKCSLDFIPRHSLIKPSTQNDLSDKPIICQGNSQEKTQYQEYGLKARLSFKPSFESRRKSNSLLDQFRNEFHKTITNNITQDQNKMAKRILSINPDKPRLSLLRYIKRRTCTNLNIEIGQKAFNDDLTEEDSSLTNTSQSNSSILTMNHEPQEFTAPPLSSSQSRLRTYNITYSDKWRTQIGLNRPEVKYSNLVLGDFSFQYSYIRDELNLIYENYEYYKRNFLLCKDMFLAFKNRDLYFQISHNKTLEEAISLLNKVPQLILMDYYQHLDRIVSIGSIPNGKMGETKIVNEDQCYIENANILNGIILFSKCCFDVYLSLGVQLTHFSLSIDDFNLLRGILEKTRFSITKIISESKACIKNLAFERKLIEDYHNTITSNKDKFKIHRHKLDEIIHNRYQFGKNEQKQKKKRMNNALSKWTQDDDRKRKIRKKLNMNQNPPMAMIVSNLFFY